MPMDPRWEGLDPVRQSVDDTETWGTNTSEDDSSAGEFDVEDAAPSVRDADIDDVDDFPRDELTHIQEGLSKWPWTVYPSQLGKCLEKAAKIVAAGHERLGDVKRLQILFREAAPNVFEKCLDDKAIWKWSDDIHIHISEALCRQMDVLVVKARQFLNDPETTSAQSYGSPMMDLDLLCLLRPLAYGFDKTSQYHVKHNKEPVPASLPRLLHPEKFAKSMLQPPAKIKSGEWFCVARKCQVREVDDCDCSKCCPLDHFGRLAYLLNYFGQTGYGNGYEILASLLRVPDRLSPGTLEAILVPVAKAVEFLHDDCAGLFLEPCKDVLQHVANLLEKDVDALSDKARDGSYTALSMILKNLQIILGRMIPIEKADATVSKVQRRMVERMLGFASFNKQLSAVREINKLLESAKAISPREPSSVSTRHSSMATAIEWLEKNDIMRHILRSHLHHKQYVDQVEKIMRFLLQERCLSEEHLDAIWAATEKPDQFEAVKNNIFDLLADLAWSFSPEQLDSLFGRFERSQGRPAADIAKILQLIKKLARSDTKGVMATRLLELLWKMMHSGDASAEVLESNAFTEILGHYHSVNCANKNVYIERCLNMLKAGDSVIPTLRLFREIIMLFAEKEFYSGDVSRSTRLRALNDEFSLLDLVVEDLVKYLNFARTLPLAMLLPTTVNERVKPPAVDGRYTHDEHVHERLRFLLFVLQAGDISMPWATTEKLWVCMIEKPACGADRERGFDWFHKATEERPVIAADAAQKLLVEKFTAIDPKSLTLIAYRCFTRLFVWVNINEKKLRKPRGEDGFMTLDLNLVGLPYLWRIVLTSQLPGIANESCMMLRDIFVCLSEGLQEEKVTIRQHFCEEILRHLSSSLDLSKALTEPTDSDSMASCGTGIDATVQHASTRDGSANREVDAERPRGKSMKLSDPNESDSVETMDMTGSELRPANGPGYGSLTKAGDETRQIQRCLQLLQVFVIKCEGRCPRKVPAHGASFEGRPFILDVSTASKPLTRFQIDVNENEYLSSVRAKVAKRLDVSPSRVRLTCQGRELAQDSQVLRQLYLMEGHTISASVTMVDRPTEVMNEEELPGILVSKLPQVYDLLFRLSHVSDNGVREAAKNLLMLLPTHPTVLSEFQELGTVTSPAEAKELLTKLFSVRSRLVYTLQVLDGILMPVNQPETPATHKFRRNFLLYGGFPFLLAVFAPGTLDVDVDDQTRRSCYVSGLRLMKLLLLGDMHMSRAAEGLADATGTVSETGTCLIRADGSVMDEGKEDITEDVVVSMSETSNGTIEPCMTPVQPEDAQAAPAAGRAMPWEPVEMEEVVQALTRLVWSTATGNISAMSGSIPTGASLRKPEELESNKRSSQFEEEDEAINNVDLYLCTEAMDLLMWSLTKQKTLLPKFLGMPMLSQFIVDIILYSTPELMRLKAMEFLLKLSDAGGQLRGSKHDPTAHKQILIALLGSKEQANQYPRRCLQFLDLLGQLMMGIQSQEEWRLARLLLEDEIDWLKRAPAAVDDSDKLLDGHLLLIGRLVELLEIPHIGSSKGPGGLGLIDMLLKVFLFPESTLLMANREEGDSPVAVRGMRFGYIGGSLGSNGFLQAKCSTRMSRMNAFRLLMLLCQNHLANFQELVEHLLRINLTVEMCDWEHLPIYGRKPPGSYVGLRNAGATCYMNSVFQQLYMQPEVRRSVLACEECSEMQKKDSPFFQIQSMFGALLGSSLDHYTPQGFWQAYRDVDDQPVNLREHQDAFEFFTRLYDTIDETLRSERREPTLTRIFGGTFAQQVICRGCPHWSEREDSFAAISVDVKNKRDLIESLESFVRADLLEADNAYFCEKCDRKVDALKRVCVKTLPHSLIIHLKRFDFDYENMQRLKLKDRFEFPALLDMKPFTVEGLAEKDRLAQQQKGAEENAHVNGGGPSSSSGTASGASPQDRTVEAQLKPDSYYNYELVGVVVHSGTAFAGHYYSYIREREGDRPLDSTDDQPNRRWIAFDDKRVELYDAADIEKDCFGGKYMVEVYDNFLKATAPQEFDRPNSAYMLLYERIASPGTRETLSPQDSPSVTGASDSKGEDDEADELMKDMRDMQTLAKRAASEDKTVQMPSSIHRSVWEENLRFIHENHLLDKDFFRFLYRVIDMNISMMEGSSGEEQARRLARGADVGARRLEENWSIEFARLAAHLTTDFLFRVLLRTHSSLREDLGPWKQLMWRLFDANPHAFKTFLQIIVVDHPYWVKQFLLKCPVEEVRQMFAQLLLQAVMCAVNYMRQNFMFQDPSNSARQQDIFHLDLLLQILIHPLVEQNFAKCYLTQYFTLLLEYARLGHWQRYHLTRMGCISLLANAATRLSIPVSHKYDLAVIHSTTSLLIRSCDISRLQDPPPAEETMMAEEEEDGKDKKDAAAGPSSSSSHSSPKSSSSGFGSNPFGLAQVSVLPHDAEEMLSKDRLYSNVLVETCPEQEDVIKLLEYCSWQNRRFSLDLVHDILEFVERANTNELKPLYSLLLRLLQIKDSVQQARQELALVGDETGMEEHGSCGLLELILRKQVSHNKRYALLKFVVRLIHVLPQVRGLLQQYKNEWKKAVDWLSEEITNGNSSPINSSPLSNEDTAGGYLQRTSTAEWTLSNARNLLSP